MEIFAFSFKIVEDVGAKLVAVAIKKTRFPIVYQLIEQTIPNLLILAITLKTPALTAIKSATGAMSTQTLHQKTSCYWQHLCTND